MHIPDGLLNVSTMAGTAALSVGVLRSSIKQTQGKLEERQVPVLGVMAAFIFAAQMVDFTIVSGITAHLLGAALAAILLGPWNASLIMTTILIIQALFFQDGGVAALGANILNMALLAPIVASIIYQGITRLSANTKFQVIGIFAAGFSSVMVAALAAAVELALSGAASAVVLLQSILGLFLPIGVVEGLITVVIVPFVQRQGIITQDNVSDKTKEGAN